MAKYIVALSGGADSVCLLLWLHNQGKVAAAAHCNFHLRGEESNRDEHFVRLLCERLNIKLLSHISTPHKRLKAQAKASKWLLDDYATLGSKH